MVARQVYSSESLAVSTTTSTTDQTKNSLVFTPDASSNYLLLHSAFHGNFTNTLNTVRAKLRNTTAGTDLAISERTAYATDNYMPFGGIARYQSSSSPVSTTFAHQYSAQNGGDSSRIRDSRIIALKMGTNDKYVESLTGSTNGSTVFMMKTQLMWTEMVGTGDYLVLASAEVSSDDGTSAIQIQLSHNMVNYGTAIIDPMNSSDYMSWACMGLFNVAALTTTSFDINYASINTNTAAIRNARIVALRLSDFENSYYSEDRTRATLANTTTYTDKLSYSPATYNLNHIVIANAMPDSNTQSATSTNYAQFLQGSTVFGEGITRPAVNRNYAMPMFTAAYLTNTSGTTYKFQQKTSTSKTLAMDEQAIALLQTAAGSSDVIITGPAGALALTGQSGTVSAGASSTGPAGALSLTGQSGTVAAGVNVSGPAGPLTLNALSGIISTGVNITGPLGTIALTGLSGTVSTGVNLSGAVGSLSLNPLSGNAGAGVNQSGPSGSIALTGLSGTVSTGVNLSGTVGQLQLSGLSGTVGDAVDIPMGLGSISLTGLSGTVSTGININGPAGPLTLNGLSGLVATGASISGPAGALSLTGLSGMVSTVGGAGVTITGSVGRMALNGLPAFPQIILFPPTKPLQLTGLPFSFANPEASTHIPMLAGSLSLLGLPGLAGISIPSDMDHSWIIVTREIDNRAIRLVVNAVKTEREKVRRIVNNRVITTVETLERHPYD